MFNHYNMQVIKRKNLINMGDELSEPCYKGQRDY